LGFGAFNCLIFRDLEMRRKGVNDGNCGVIQGKSALSVGHPEGDIVMTQFKGESDNRTNPKGFFLR
jgi:hypothetical protein